MCCLRTPRAFIVGNHTLFFLLLSLDHFSYLYSIFTNTIVRYESSEWINQLQLWTQFYNMWCHLLVQGVVGCFQLLLEPNPKSKWGMFCSLLRKLLLLLKEREKQTVEEEFSSFSAGRGEERGTTLIFIDIYHPLYWERTVHDLFQYTLILHILLISLDQSVSPFRTVFQ